MSYRKILVVKSNLMIMVLLLLILPNLSSGNGLNNEGDGYLAFAEKMPAPVGGLNAIYKKIKYPTDAKKAGIQGKVYLLVFVKEDGSVGDVKTIKKLGGGCDEAAIRALKSSKFTPGEVKGKKVKVKLSLALEFKI